MAVGIPSIDKLQLDVAFGKRFEKAWTVRADSRLLVIDDDADQISKFSDSEDDEPRALVVLNEKNKLIVLLAIDHKLIDNHPGGITDCAVFDDEQLEFVEFKTNAYGNSEESIRDTFEKACDQLKETLTVFAFQWAYRFNPAIRSGTMVLAVIFVAPGSVPQYHPANL